MSDFMKAKDLGITPEERIALIAVLKGFERGDFVHTDAKVSDVLETFKNGKLPKLFNLGEWATEKSAKQCGAVACIGGWAQLTYRDLFKKRNYRGFEEKADEVGNYQERSLYDLFYPSFDTDYGEITVEQAAEALRNYLVTGRADWDTIVGY